MRHTIDPKIDCVFKALLGAEENNNLLIHFLNAFLAQELAEPLVWAEILNPYNEKEYLSDKLSIVDIKARDKQQRVYQIEIQLTVYPSLPARIIYNWADIYSQQLQSGDEYYKLKPTYAIWLLAEDLLLSDQDYLHHYKMRDEQGQSFCQHGGIWLVELNKFKNSQINNEQQRWMKFFKDGASLNDNALPEWMLTQEMQQAMNTLSTFSEKERRYDQYQARQEFLREQRTIQYELEQRRLLNETLQQRTEAAEHREEEAKQQAEAARQQAEAAKQQAEVAKQQTEVAEQQAQSAQQQANAEKQRADEAAKEIADLKTLLANIKQN